MDFDFSDDQETISEAAQRFAKGRLTPIYLAHDEAETFDKDLI